MATLDELLEQHRECVARNGTDRELAIIENAVMDAAPANVPRTPYTLLLRWKSSVLGQSGHAIRCRRDLFIARDAADPLWRCIQKGMPLGTAKRLLRQAKKRVDSPRRNRTAYARAIEEEIARERAPWSSATEPEAPPAEPSSDFVAPEPSVGPREFWARLRQVVTEHMRPRLEFLPEHERDRLLDDFERDVQAVFAQHNTKWQKTSRHLEDQRRVSRHRFINALRVLHMDPPRRNAPLGPVLTQANKQKRTLARLYHPDSHGGSEHTRAQYQAVLDAYLVVEQYTNENIKPATPKLRLVGGSKKE